jgi:aminoglycoside phosphotransferase (APT) family kinase protein
MGEQRESKADGSTLALDQHLQQVALALYGILPQIHRLHSENSYVCCLHFGQALPDKVIKYARSNAKQVLREQTILRVLNHGGLPVPVVEFTQDDCPIETSPFFTMPRLAEISLQEACLSRAPWAGAALGQAGRFLARLSALSPGLWVGRLGPPPIARLPPPLEKWALAAYLTVEEQQALACHLRTIAGLLDDASNLAHGSYSPAHILCDGAGAFAAIDWENAHGGSVLRDLGHFLAALEVWAGGDAEHARLFLDGFQAERPLSRRERHTIDEWALYTSLVWADFITKQGRHGAAMRVLTAARSHLGAAEG